MSVTSVARRPSSTVLLAAFCLLPPVYGVFFFSRDTVPVQPRTLPDCDCEEEYLCHPVTRPKTAQSEVFAFVLNCTQETWSTFDWEKLTTIVLMDFYDAALVCHAHKQNVRVLMNANFLKTNVTNATYRADWVSRQVNYTLEHHLDGVNVDFEDPVGAREPARAAFVELLNATKQELDRVITEPTILVVDVPWSPDCIDGRCYDFVGLSNVTDMLFIMSYDLRSQVNGKDCLAGPNSPLNETLAGVRKYISLGINADKLVMGVPWYGYDYPCLNLTHNGTRCEIRRVPFRGVNCSDAAGTQRPYKQLAVWEPYSTKLRWSNTSETPYYNIKFADWNQTHQVWYDNATSLTYKYMGAASLKLGGLGIWAANFLATGNSSFDRAQRNSMWGAVPRWSWRSDAVMVWPTPHTGARPAADAADALSRWYGYAVRRGEHLIDQVELSLRHPNRTAR